MPPRPGIESDDLVTTGQFAANVPGLRAATLSMWVKRAEKIIDRKVEPLGRLGTYPVYDFNDLAALEREMRRRKQQRAAGLASAA